MRHETVKSVWPFVQERYLTLDRRVLGVFRVVFGLVLFVDVVRRFERATLFYSNDGILSNHFSLFAPLARPYFSLFVLFSTPPEARLALGATALVFVAYTVGYRTRLAQVLGFVLYTSLNARNLFLENGGTVVAALVLAWTMFAPVGDRFSVDAMLAELQCVRSERVRPPDSFVSLAAVAIASQIAVIYTFNVLHKAGPTWSTGEAIHLVLWQNRIATPVAGWLRMHEPRWLSPLLTRETFLIEGLAPILVLSPFKQPYTRTLGFVLTSSLHLGIALLMSLGPFSYVMVCLNVLLLPKETADWIARRVKAGRVGHAIARARAVCERTFEPFVEQQSSAPTVAEGTFTGQGVWLRETCIFVLMAASTVQVSNENPAVPSFLHVRPTPVLSAIIEYPRLFQGWSMFSPDAPQQDGTLVIDGETADHRHIDPFTGKPPDLDAPLHGPWYPGSLLCDYINQMGQQRGYDAELQKYLLNWQAIEGRPPEDALVSVAAYWVSNDAPFMGETTPRNLDRRTLFRVPSSDRPSARQ